MIRRALENGTGQVRATFVVPGVPLYGRVVTVVGDFNHWDPAANPMHAQRDARLATAIMPVGRRYAFRYLCHDGAWFNDEAADAYEANDFGVDNSILDLTGAD